MPYVEHYVEPAIFATLDGVDVYHAYHRFSNGERLQFHYQIKSGQDDREYTEFDIRNVAFHLVEAGVSAPSPTKIVQVGERGTLLVAASNGDHMSVLLEMLKLAGGPDKVEKWLESHGIAREGER